MKNIDLIRGKLLTTIAEMPDEQIVDLAEGICDEEPHEDRFAAACRSFGITYDNTCCKFCAELHGRRLCHDPDFPDDSCPYPFCDWAAMEVSNDL